MHDVRIGSSRTYVLLATRQGKWVVLSQIIGFVYVYVASNSIYELAFGCFAACQFAISIAWVKYEKRVRYNRTHAFNILRELKCLLAATTRKRTVINATVAIATSNYLTDDYSVYLCITKVSEYLFRKE